MTSEITKPSYSDDVDFVVGNDVFVCRYEAIDLFSTNSSRTEITQTPDYDVVKKWEGYGNPLGVAKQSGTEGQQIEVYIPSV